MPSPHREHLAVTDHKADRCSGEEGAHTVCYAGAKIRARLGPSDEKRVQYRLMLKREFQTHFDDSDAGQTQYSGESYKKHASSDLTKTLRFLKKLKWTLIWMPQPQIRLMNTHSFQNSKGCSY